MVVGGHFRHAAVEFIHRAEEQRACHVHNAGRLQHRRLAFHRAQLIRVNVGEAYANLAGFCNVQNRRVRNTEQNRDRQVKDHRREHRDEELADAGF